MKIPRTITAILVAVLLAAAPALAARGAGGEIEIVGGDEVDPPGKYPFIAALVYSYIGNAHLGHFCGGSLISDEWVLTAGHCVTRGNGSVISAASIDVVVGRHDLKTADGERVGVAAIHRHPGYHDGTLENDVALLQLDQAVTTGEAIELAGEGDAAAFAPGVESTVIGWGLTYGEPPGTPVDPSSLREVSVPIVDDADCTTAYGSDLYLPEMICAGETLGGEDACSGDSGGPLFVLHGGGYLHVGVVSWGNDCALPGYPGVYARTATYSDWVQTTSGVGTVRCEGEAATVIGTSGDDVLEGTSGRDVIVGGEGDDIIRGLGSDDLICAGSGDDLVLGGAGDDEIHGEGGHDTIEGGSGDDTINAGAGDDSVMGEDGADTIDGTRGEDDLSGGDGDDTVRGGPDADTVTGGDGADHVKGGTGHDLVSGGTGDDRAKGEGGNDEVKGEGGDDSLSGGPGTDTIVGGGGTDVCVGGETVDCETARAAFTPKPL